MGGGGGGGVCDTGDKGLMCFHIDAIYRSGEPIVASQIDVLSQGTVTMAGSFISYSHNR